jgi:predicted RNase H-like HicB family nuclease
MSVTFPISIKIIYEPEAVDAPFVAYIPEFDISSCGKTEEEAKKNVREVLGITLEEVKKKNKLEDFLKEAGISMKKSVSFPKISFEPFVFHA